MTFNIHCVNTILHVPGRRSYYNDIDRTNETTISYNITTCDKEVILKTYGVNFRYWYSLIIHHNFPKQTYIYK